MMRASLDILAMANAASPHDDAMGAFVEMSADGDAQLQAARDVEVMLKRRRASLWRFVTAS